MSLTAKQAAFVREYLIDLNATQAAIRAGYSSKTATEQGSRLLTNVNVQKAVKEEQDRRAGRVEWTAADILRGIKDIADSRTAKDQDRLRAYELGGRHLGMFKDKIEHSGSLGVTIQNDIPRK